MFAGIYQGQFCYIRIEGNDGIDPNNNTSNTSIHRESKLRNVLDNIYPNRLGLLHPDHGGLDQSA